MIDFIRAFFSADIPFLRYAMFAGLLASFAFGVIGSYVVARRISYIAGSIAHCVLGGIGVGLFLQVRIGWSWFDPMYGAVIAAIIAALLIGLVSLYAKQREDTVIGALWAMGMAVGLVFIAKTPGYIDPMSYLFGNILLITKSEIWLVLGLDLIVVGAGLLFYNKLLAVCFEDEFTRLRGVNVDAYYLFLLTLTALSVVLLVRVVGVVMVIALLTLPPAVAGTLTHKLWHMMIVAILFCMIFITMGMGISYIYDLPSGPTIIIFAAIVYVLILVAKKFTRKTAHPM